MCHKYQLFYRVTVVSWSVSPVAFQSVRRFKYQHLFRIELFAVTLIFFTSVVCNDLTYYTKPNISIVKFDQCAIHINVFLPKLIE